jgi:hypothetical protein
MKSSIIFLFIMVASIGSMEQTTVRNTAIKTQVYDIKFNPLGKPNENWQYVPYGSQVNLIATDVNPLKELPKVEAFFKNYNVTNAGDAVDLASLLAPPKATNSNNAENAALSEQSLAKTTALVGKTVAENKNLRNSSTLSNEISLFSKNLTSAKFADSTQGVEKLARANNNLQNIDTELERLRLENKASNTEIDKLKEVIAQLQKELDRQENIKKLTPQINTSYNAFINSLSEVHSLLTLKPAVNALFNEQFVDGVETKKRIVELVKSRIATVDDTLKNAINEQTAFIKSKLESLENQYTVLSIKIKLINDQLPSDSFKSEGLTKISLKNKDKVESQLEIKDITVRVAKDPLFKDELDYATGIIKQFRRQSFRDSLQIYTDSVLINTLKLYHHSFEKPIKTFQANADEITVNLPYATAEPFIIKTTNRFKVTGSTGLFVHLLNTGDKYKTVLVDSASPSTGKYPLLIQQEKEKVLYSFGISANFFNYVPSRWFNVGGTLGINVPINNQSNTGFLQLVGGLCFASNTVDRLIISVGASIRRGQKLNINNLVKVTDNGANGYKFKNSSELEPVYDPTAQVGFFIGISYSLFGSGKSTKNE